jgi:hypothetical protein
MVLLMKNTTSYIIIFAFGFVFTTYTRIYFFFFFGFWFLCSLAGVFNRHRFAMGEEFLASFPYSFILV